MKRWIFTALLFAVGVCWAEYPAGYFYVIFRGDTFCVSPVITDSVTEAEWFDYTSASMHTGFETAYESHIFFFYNPMTGNIGMVIQHNIDVVGTADATCVLYIDDMPPGCTLAMSDDPGEFDLSAYPQGDWHWWYNTDGGAFYIPRDEWQFTLRLTFGSTDPIRSYWFISGDLGEDRIYLDTVYIDQEDTIVVGHSFLEMITFIDSLDFDSTNVGTVDTLHFPVCNSGETADTLSIGDIDLPSPEVFSLLYAPTILAPGECDDFIFLFHPPDTGIFRDTIVLHMNTVCDSVQPIAVYGRAIQPRIDTVWFYEETDCDGQNIVNVCYVLYGEATTPLAVQVDFSPDDTSDLWFSFDDFTTDDADDDWGDDVLPGQHCFTWHLDDDWTNEFLLSRVRVGLVVPLDTFDVIDSITSDCTIGLGWDGEYLVGIGGSGQMCRIDTATGAHTDCFTVGHFHNGDAACTPDGKIFYTSYSTSSPSYEAIWWTDFDTHTENLFFTDSISCLGGTYSCAFQGLTTDGEYIWSIDSYGWLRKFEIATGIEVDSLHIPEFVSDSALETRSDGLAYVEPYLFISDNSANIYKYDPETHSIIRRYFAPPTASSTGPEGLAFDGEYLWYQDHSRGKIYKIQLSTELSSEVIAFAPLDSKGPIVDITCPLDTLFYGDTATFIWGITDMFPNAGEPCSVIVRYCEGADTFLLNDSLVWTPPLVACETTVVSIAAPDSFCNWGYDSCSFTLMAAGWISISFPESTVMPCETLVIPLKIDSLLIPFTSEVELNLTFNSDVVRVLDFTPMVSPAPDSFSISGIGDSWTVILRWDERVIMEGEIFGNITLAVNCDVIGGEFSVLNIDTVIADLVDVYYADGLLLVDYTPQQWLQPIFFDDISDTSRSATLSFGNATSATDGYDDAYDLLYLPPPPTEADVWFVMDDAEHPAVQKLSRDIRDMNPINTWTAVINEDANIYVHWNPDNFDEGTYTLNGVQDMRADTDYIASPLETLRITWNLPELSVGAVTFEEGWNLLSLPYYNPSGEPSSVFFGAFAGPFGYDPIGGAYFIADNVQPGLGYWVYYNEAGEIPAVGIPVERYGTIVYRGWNLVGATMSAVPADSIAVAPETEIMQVFGYNPASGYIIADTLAPGKGYWILVNGDGTLWVPEH